MSLPIDKQETINNRNSKNRISILGLLKFIASLFIVWRHMRFILGTSEYRFNSSYIFVEFFLMISGYFAYRFAKKIIRNSTERKIGLALNYTKKQYLSLLPLIIVGTLMSLLTCIMVERPTYRGIFELIKEGTFSVLPFAAFIRGDNVPIWYLSAYFLILPFFILLASSNKKKAVILLVSTLAICYYCSMPYPYTSGMACLLRAFVGLSCGIIIDVVAEKIRHLKVKNSVLYLLFVACILMVPLLIAPSDVNYLVGNCGTPLVIILFILALSILISGRTHLTSINSKILDFLESISTIIYLIHYPIILFLANFTIGSNPFVRVLIVYIITLILSLLIKMVFISLEKKSINKYKND